MKISVRLFLSSMTFAIVIATVYAFTTHDIVGTVFLAMMAVALVVVAIFILVAEKEAHLASDVPSAQPRDSSGEDLGMFTLESYWPIVGAAATTLLVLGVVFLPGPSATTSLVAAAALFFVLRFLLREST